MLSVLMRMGAAGLDVGGSAVRALGPEVGALVPDRLCARASARTGLADFGTWEYDQALEIACGSLESEADLRMVGRIMLREHLTLALQSRLHRIQAHKEHPEVFRASLNRPLIVLGLPRSGTTFLHRLLVELPGARGLASWEIRRPFPPASGTDRRRDEAAWALWVLKMLAPDLDRKHVLDPDAAEEEVGLFDSCLWTPSLWRLAAVRSYQSWYLTRDPGPGYAVFRELLQWFQAGDPSARLVLKLPNHLGFVRALLDAIPEAMVVQTHRDPVPVIASYNSLMNSVHRATTNRVDAVRNGHDALEMWGTLAERCVEQRASLADGRVLDVAYDQLVADPLGTVRAIHSHFDLPFGEVETGIVEHLVSERKQHAHGKHVYALQDTRLDRDRVDRRFDVYRSTYL